MTAEADDVPEGIPLNLGALLGWKAFRSGNGIVLRLETAVSRQQAAEGHASLQDVALNLRQMRALAHNLARLADEHEGIDRPEKKRWWRR